MPLLSHTLKTLFFITLLFTTQATAGYSGKMLSLSLNTGISGISDKTAFEMQTKVGFLLVEDNFAFRPQLSAQFSFGKDATSQELALGLNFGPLIEMCSIMLGAEFVWRPWETDHPKGFRGSLQLGALWLFGGEIAVQRISYGAQAHTELQLLLFFDFGVMASNDFF